MLFSFGFGVFVKSKIPSEREESVAKAAILGIKGKEKLERLKSEKKMSH